MPPLATTYHEIEADRIARSAGFDTDPVALFDRTTDRFGAEDAAAIWKRACELYDLLHAGDA